MSGSEEAPKDSRAAEEALEFSDQPLHLTFQNQVAEILAKADLTEEQKQLILIAMSCPCCGAGALSFSLDLKDDEPPRF